MLFYFYAISFCNTLTVTATISDSNYVDELINQNPSLASVKEEIKLAVDVYHKIKNCDLTVDLLCCVPTINLPWPSVAAIQGSIWHCWH